MRDRLEDILYCLPDNWETHSARLKLKRLIREQDAPQTAATPYPHLVEDRN